MEAVNDPRLLRDREQEFLTSLCLNFTCHYSSKCFKQLKTLAHFSCFSGFFWFSYYCHLWVKELFSLCQVIYFFPYLFLLALWRFGVFARRCCWAVFPPATSWKIRWIGDVECVRLVVFEKFKVERVSVSFLFFFPLSHNAGILIPFSWSERCACLPHLNEFLLNFTLADKKFCKKTKTNPVCLSHWWICSCRFSWSGRRMAWIRVKNLMN